MDHGSTPPMVLLNVDMFPGTRSKPVYQGNYIQQNPRVRSPGVLVRKTESPCLHCTNILEMRLYLFKWNRREIVHLNASVEIFEVRRPIGQLDQVAMEMPVYVA
jgi:hypothetical protein